MRFSRRIAAISLIVGCQSQAAPDAWRTTIEQDAGEAGCGTPPGPICDGMCTEFACGDPVCTPRCGTACYECRPGVLSDIEWLPVVTDCFCRDGGVDGSESLDASGEADDAGDANDGA